MHSNVMYQFSKWESKSDFVNKSTRFSNDWIFLFLYSIVLIVLIVLVWRKTLEIYTLYSWIWWSIFQVKLDMQHYFHIVLLVFHPKQSTSSSNILGNGPQPYVLFARFIECNNSAWLKEVTIVDYFNSTCWTPGYCNTSINEHIASLRLSFISVVGRLSIFLVICVR